MSGALAALTRLLTLADARLFWNSWASSNSLAALLVWLLMLALLLLLGLPPALALFGHWRDAGVAWARTLALLLLGYLVWLPASYGVWRYSTASVVGGVLLLLLLDALLLVWLGWRASSAHMANT